MEKNFLKNKNGQVMLTVVLTLGGVMLITSAISGILINNQIRQATNIVNSTKAIYAADSGVEAGYYFYLKNITPINPTFSNKATTVIKCLDANRNQVSCNSPSVSFIVGQGTSQKVTRALELSL